MKTTTYICDNCKKSVSEGELIHLEVSLIGDIFIRGADRRRQKQSEMDICKDCLRKRGFVIEEPENGDDKKDVLAKNQKTLEGKMIDLLEDLGVAFTV